MPVQTRKRKAALAQAAGEEKAEAPPTSSAKPTTKRQKKLPVRSKEGEHGDLATPKANIITFDEDGNTDQQPIPSSKPAKPSQPQKTGEEETESDSDDEAPEAVSTSKVALEMKKSAQAAQKAAQEQAAAEKKKRQQRDALLKKQAAERKQTQDTEPKALAGEEATQVTIPSKQAEVVTGRRRVEKTEIPNILPAEFLTDSSGEESADETMDGEGLSRPRKRKVSSVEKRLSRDARGPRDEAIGSTVYRVSKKVDERLAPKVKQYSKSTKEMLLKRGRAPVKATSSGFFKK